MRVRELLLTPMKNWLPTLSASALEQTGRTAAARPGLAGAECKRGTAQPKVQRANVD